MEQEENNKMRQIQSHYCYIYAFFLLVFCQKKRDTCNLGEGVSSISPPWAADGGGRSAVLEFPRATMKDGVRLVDVLTHAFNPNLTLKVSLVKIIQL